MPRPCKRLLYRARTGVKLGASAAPNGEEASALFLAREEMGPLLAYALEDPEWQVIVAMRDLLQDLYSDTPPLMDLGVSVVAQQCRAHCCKAAFQSNYLLYLEEDVATAVANAARLETGLGTACADVVESLNAILKRDYNDHTARWGGGGGGTSLEKKAEIVLQAWEWWFLKFDPPFRTLGTPHVAPCTMAALMSTKSPPPMSLSVASPPRVSPVHGLHHDGGVDGKDDGKNDQQSGMCLCVCVFLLASRL